MPMNLKRRREIAVMFDRDTYENGRPCLGPNFPTNEGPVAALGYWYHSRWFWNRYIQLAEVGYRSQRDNAQFQIDSYLEELDI